MLEITKGLSKKIRELNDDKCKLSLLKDKYNGKTCYILSCGPSINDIWSNNLMNFLKDKLCISIKQTLDLAPEIFDFHFFNGIRLKEYKNRKEETINISVFNKIGNEDIFFPLNTKSSLLTTNDYEKYNLDKCFDRCWGPGIMLELGLYIPLYIGCKKIIIFGWDMNKKETIHYHRNIDYSKEMPSVIDECDKLIKSGPIIEKWLKSKGVEIKLCSPRSSIPIKQIKVEDLYD